MHCLCCCSYSKTKPAFRFRKAGSETAYRLLNDYQLCFRQECVVSRKKQNQLSERKFVMPISVLAVSAFFIWRIYHSCLCRKHSRRSYMRQHLLRGALWIIFKAFLDSRKPFQEAPSAPYKVFDCNIQIKTPRRHLCMLYYPYHYGIYYSLCTK